MFKLLTGRRDLVAETALSHFVHKASAAEKHKLYNRAIQQAVEEQRQVIEFVQKKRAPQHNAHA